MTRGCKMQLYCTPSLRTGHIILWWWKKKKTKAKNAAHIVRPPKSTFLSPPYLYIVWKCIAVSASLIFVYAPQKWSTLFSATFPKCSRDPTILKEPTASCWRLWPRLPCWTACTGSEWTIWTSCTFCTIFSNVVQTYVSPQFITVYPPLENRLSRPEKRRDKRSVRRQRWTDFGNVLASDPFGRATVNDFVFRKSAVHFQVYWHRSSDTTLL